MINDINMDEESDIIDITGESPEMRGRSDEESSSRRHARYYSPKRNAEKRASFERKRRSFEARRQSGSGKNQHLTSLGRARITGRGERLLKFSSPDQFSL